MIRGESVGKEDEEENGRNLRMKGDRRWFLPLYTDISKNHKGAGEESIHRVLKSYLF